MLTLYLLQFAKRENSTKTPTQADLQGATQLSVALKGGCDMLNPTWIINNENVPASNYAYFNNRYYFITGISSIRNNLVEITGRVDVLASWQADILATNALVLYAGNGRDDIIDPRIPITQDVSVDSAVASISGFTITDNNQGSIILSLTGVGSFGNFLMQSPNRLANLIDGIDTYWDSLQIVDTWTAMKQFFFGGNAADCIKSAIALPIIPPSSWYGGSAVELYLGKYPTNEYGYKLTVPTFTGSATVSIPWQNSGWRKHAPYSKLYLYLPLSGMVTLPTDDLINETSLHVEYSINGFSGDYCAAVRAGSGSGRIITTVSGNCATATPYGSAAMDTGRISQGVVSGGMGIGVGLASMASNPVAGATAIGSGIAGIAGSLISGVGGESTGAGGLSGGASQGLDKVVHCYCVSKTLTDSPADYAVIMGKPKMEKAQISTVTGFCQTDGFSVSGSMTDPERSSINSYLDRGVYIE